MLRARSKTTLSFLRSAKRDITSAVETARTILSSLQCADAEQPAAAAAVEARVFTTDPRFDQLAPSSVRVVNIGDKPTPPVPPQPPATAIPRANQQRVLEDVARKMVACARRQLDRGQVHFRPDNATYLQICDSLLGQKATFDSKEEYEI